VPYIAANNRKSSGFHISLDSSRDIVKTISRISFFNAFIKRFSGYLQEPLRQGRNLSHGKSSGRVTIVALVKHAYVNTDNITCFKAAQPGNSVNYLLVERSADARRKAVVSQKGRTGARLLDILAGQGIQLYGGYSRSDSSGQLLKGAGYNTTGLPHKFYFLKRFYNNQCKLLPIS
jgi:hypothetical protein